MCNDKPFKKRRGRGPAKPTPPQLETKLRMTQYQLAIKDRPPGCKCIYRGDTCKVCRPHLYGAIAACAVLLFACCPTLLADPRVEVIIQPVPKEVVIATGFPEPVVVVTQPSPDTAVVVRPQPVQPPFQPLHSAPHANLSPFPQLP